MLRVTLRNNTMATSRIVDENTTVREFLDANEVDYSTGMTSLDGAPLQVGDMDKSFKALGVTSDSCFLSVVKKLDNANR